LILNMANLLDQLYKTKLQLIVVVAGVVGIAMMMLAKWAPVSGWLTALLLPVPLGELDGTVFSIGLLAVFFEYVDRKHGDERTDQPIQNAVRREPQPSATRCWTASPSTQEALKGIASTDALNRIATNALGLRPRRAHPGPRIRRPEGDRAV
jgi:hypothetical protein